MTELLLEHHLCKHDFSTPISVNFPHNFLLRSFAAAGDWVPAQIPSLITWFLNSHLSQFSSRFLIRSLLLVSEFLLTIISDSMIFFLNTHPSQIFSHILLPLSYGLLNTVSNNFLHIFFCLFFHSLLSCCFSKPISDKQDEQNILHPSDFDWLIDWSSALYNELNGFWFFRFWFLGRWTSCWFVQRSTWKSK